MRHFYENEISDDINVLQYPKIVGLKRRIFFINHANDENALSIDKSKANRHEAEYLSQLCLYLTKQNYDQSKITILTMYLGQLVEIKSICKRLKLQNVKISTVDNYQVKIIKFYLILIH
jgi:superfamily I DNA and/or RNA helicase